jgi:hypothetical protein
MSATGMVWPRIAPPVLRVGLRASERSRRSYSRCANPASIIQPPLIPTNSAKVSWFVLPIHTARPIATGQGGDATLPERMPFRLQKRNRSGDIMTATHTGLMALLNPGLAEK